MSKREQLKEKPASAEEQTEQNVAEPQAPEEKVTAETYRSITRCLFAGLITYGPTPKPIQNSKEGDEK